MVSSVSSFQVYVALSRVVSLAGMWIRGADLTQAVVKAHPKVAAFYRAQEIADADAPRR